MSTTAAEPRPHKHGTKREGGVSGGGSGRVAVLAVCSSGETDSPVSVIRIMSGRVCDEA